MKIRNTLSAFVGQVITSVLGETNMRNFVTECIKADLKTRGDEFAEMISENLDRDHLVEMAAEKISERMSTDEIAEEVRNDIKGDLDTDTIRDDIHTEIKDDIDTDDLRTEIAKEVIESLDTSDICDNVKQEIIDGIDDDFTALVVEEISGKISPDDVSTEVVTELCENGNFVETVKREVIATLARVFADSYSEDFKSAVRTLAQGAQTVLKATEEILYTNPKDALDEAIDEMESEQASRLDRFKQVMSIKDLTEEEDRAVELKRSADALKIAAYNDALDAANRTSMAYSHELAKVSKQQEVARLAEDMMSNAYGVLKAAEVGAKEAGVDIRLQCKVL